MIDPNHNELNEEEESSEFNLFYGEEEEEDFLENESEDEDEIEIKPEIVSKKWSYEFDVQVNGISNLEDIEIFPIHTDFGDYFFKLMKAEGDLFKIYGVFFRSLENT